MLRRFWSAKLLRLFLTADECHNNQPIFKNSWLTSMILQRFSYSKRVVVRTNVMERNKKRRSNASPRRSNENGYLLANNLQLHVLCWLQCYAVDGLALALICHRCINLSGGNILVSKDVLDGINTRTSFDL